MRIARKILGDHPIYSFVAVLVFLGIACFACANLNRPLFTRNEEQLEITEVMPTLTESDEPKTPTPPPTSNTLSNSTPALTPTLLATLTPLATVTLNSSGEGIANACIPETEVVPWFQYRHVGVSYEEGYLPTEKDGVYYYPSISTTTGIAMRISDKELGNPRFWDNVPYDIGDLFLGYWPAPKYSLIRVQNMNGMYLDLENKVAGPTGRVRDIAAGETPKDIVLSAEAWERLYPGVDPNSTQPVTITILRCGG